MAEVRLQFVIVVFADHTTYFFIMDIISIKAIIKVTAPNSKTCMQYRNIYLFLMVK